LSGCHEVFEFIGRSIGEGEKSPVLR
jgi:hypothetical protein